MTEIVVDCCNVPDVAVTVTVEVVGLGFELPPHALSEPSPNAQAASSDKICRRRRCFQPMQHTSAARVVPGNKGLRRWLRVAVLAETVNVRVDVALPFAAGVIDVEENVATTPAGSPVTVRATGELKLFTLAIVTALVPLVS